MLGRADAGLAGAIAVDIQGHRQAGQGIVEQALQGQAAARILGMTPALQNLGLVLEGHGILLARPVAQGQPGQLIQAQIAIDLGEVGLEGLQVFVEQVPAAIDGACGLARRGLREARQRSARLARFGLRLGKMDPGCRVLRIEPDRGPVGRLRFPFSPLCCKARPR